MKVNNSNVGATQAREITGDKKISKKNSNANVPGASAEKLSGSAKVNMSDRAQMMQKAKDIAGKDTVDEARVAHLQKMIDSGKYSVDAAAVADRLVDEHIATGE